MDIRATVRSTAVSQMEAAIESLSRDLGKLRTGRASIGMPSVCDCGFLVMDFRILRICLIG